jgi:hypothetical protein
MYFSFFYVATWTGGRRQDRGKDRDYMHGLHRFHRGHLARSLFESVAGDRTFAVESSSSCRRVADTADVEADWSRSRWAVGVLLQNRLDNAPIFPEKQGVIQGIVLHRLAILVAMHPSESGTRRSVLPNN